jgi:hypothetical protein
VSASNIRFDPALPDEAELLLGLARAFHQQDGHPPAPVGVDTANERANALERSRGLTENDRRLMSLRLPSLD